MGIFDCIHAHLHRRRHRENRQMLRAGRIGMLRPTSRAWGVCRSPPPYTRVLVRLPLPTARDARAEARAEFVVPGRASRWMRDVPEIGSPEGVCGSLPSAGAGRPAGEDAGPSGPVVPGSSQAGHPRCLTGGHDLGGHHLTTHRLTATHGWTTSFLGAPTTRAHVPATGNRPPTAGPRHDPLRPARPSGSEREGAV